jgi:hypothetical protein
MPQLSVVRFAMSESSQFFATSTDVCGLAFKSSMNSFQHAAGNSTYGRDIRFCATKSVADRLQAPMFEVYPVLCRWAVSDANGACSDAKLFICSPHSCEVVKTRFFHALLKT